MRNLVEVIPDLDRRGPSLAVEGLLPRLGPRHLLDDLLQPVALLLGDARGCDHTTPVGQLDVDVALLERRGVRQRLDPLGTRDRDRPQLARLDLGDELRDARDPTVSGRDNKVAIASPPPECAM